MPGNDQRRNKRTSSKKGATIGSGGKRRQSLEGRGRTLPAEERPWHKAYEGMNDVPKRTAWRQDKERRAAAAEGRAPKAGSGKGTAWERGVAGTAGRGASAGF